MAEIFYQQTAPGKDNYFERTRHFFDSLKGMHTEILLEDTKQLLPLIQQFNKNFAWLAALQILLTIYL